MWSLALPMVVFVWVDAYASYRAALQTAQTAFDRLLVTGAHALGDLIWLERGQLQVSLPHAALELYAGDVRQDLKGAPSRSPLIYRVSYVNGQFLAGDEQVAPYTGLPPVNQAYAARLLLYDTEMQGEAVRMVALWQPVESAEGLRHVVVQVGEFAAYRQNIGKSILWQTLGRQAVLLLVLLVAVWAVASLALRPLRVVARQFERRDAQDFTPLVLAQPPQEMQPMVQAFNGLLGRMRHAQAQQQRFVGDASHQLRTPLAVLQLHAQSGLSGDVPMQEALQSIAATTLRTTRVVQQLLSWTRARDAAPAVRERLDVREVMKNVAVQLSPLIAQRRQVFDLQGPGAYWLGSGWMLEEILMNLLHNAIQYTPAGKALGMDISLEQDQLVLRIWDTGPGLSAQMQADLFTPFVRGDGEALTQSGAGLGLAICRDLALACGGQLEVSNRLDGQVVTGLDARLRLRVQRD